MKPGNRPHSWTKFPKGSHLPWSYCRYCGLVSLNNALTRKAIQAGCEP